MSDSRSGGEESSGEGELAARWSGELQRFMRTKGESLDSFLALYAEDVHFEDPILVVDGIAAFAEMNRRFAAHARSLDIEVGDVAAGGGVFFAAWKMTLAPRVGPRISVPGATHVRVRAGKIVSQRDHFDPAGSFIRAIPGLFPIYRLLATKLA